MRELAGIAALFAGLWLAAAEAGFRSPESLVRNVYAYHGEGPEGWLITDVESPHDSLRNLSPERLWIASSLRFSQ
jgi:hypothetical protein